MNEKHPPYAAVEKILRMKSFGVITTVDAGNRPHATGILYGVSPPGRPLRLFVLTRGNAAKVRHIKQNPSLSLLVPIPHHVLRFIPDSTVAVNGTADLTTLNDLDFREAFNAKRVLKMNLEVDPETLGNAVVIRVKPEPVIHCYGAGMSLMKLGRNPTGGSFKVRIPEERL